MSTFVGATNVAGSARSGSPAPAEAKISRSPSARLQRGAAPNRSVTLPAHSCLRQPRSMRVVMHPVGNDLNAAARATK